MTTTGTFYSGIGHRRGLRYPSLSGISRNLVVWICTSYFQVCAGAPHGGRRGNYRTGVRLSTSRSNIEGSKQVPNAIHLHAGILLLHRRYQHRNCIGRSVWFDCSRCDNYRTHDYHSSDSIRSMTKCTRVHKIGK